MDNSGIIQFNWNIVSDYRDQTNPKTRGWLIPKYDFELVKGNVYSNFPVIVKIDSIVRLQKIVLGEYTPHKRRLKIKESYQLRKPDKDKPSVLTVIRKPVYKCGYLPVAFLHDNNIICRLVNMNIFTNS